MSAFEEKNNNEGTEPESYFQELVGEDKKFKSEEDLAKGKWEADRYVQDLERQIAELREDINKDDKVSELLELVRSQNDQGTQNNSSNSGTEDGEGGGENSNGTSSNLTEEQVKALIEGHVKERESTTQRQRNLSQVDERLESEFGDKAGQFIQTKSKEIGMSAKEMEDIAARNPSAFYQLVGLNQKPGNQSTFVGTSHSSEHNPGKQRDRRNFAYYQKLRRENRKEYYSPRTQHQMFVDAKEQGQSFYED